MSYRDKHWRRCLVRTIFADGQEIKNKKKFLTFLKSYDIIIIEKEKKKKTFSQEVKKLLDKYN